MKKFVEDPPDPYAALKAKYDEKLRRSPVGRADRGVDIDPLLEKYGIPRPDVDAPTGGSATLAGVDISDYKPIDVDLLRRTYRSLQNDGARADTGGATIKLPGSVKITPGARHEATTSPSGQIRRDAAADRNRDSRGSSHISVTHLESGTPA